MSTTSNEIMQKVDNIIQSRIIPKWVNNLLEKAFFEKCPNHDLQKNELNRYCISCDASICKYCITSDVHKKHKILTIYRHVYQNVVPLTEMEIHIDCDIIQPYKCNKKWVVSLNPLPHNGSGSLIEGDGACNVCKRKLTDPDRFRFCSIACKVQAVSGTVIIQLPEQQHVRGDAADQQLENPSKRKRSRKGVPYRAPFF
ncbi:hypothetical protein CASFOL_015532 [Castilleja foliolosa]|uniref:B box-type domain-containing protein n=1 Tax=Castilleja foliolosa TaxID=1961234 RepID=A0ABD3DHG0_9LAMI